MSETKLTDLLLGLDAGTLKEIPTATMRIPSLSKKLGQNVEITVQALSGRRITDLSAMAIGKNGTVEYSKAFDTNLLIVAEGVKEPNLKDKDLQDHFKARSPKELAEILFNGGEVVDIASKIRELSGYAGEDLEEEVKN